MAIQKFGATVVNPIKKTIDTAKLQKAMEGFGEKCRVSLERKYGKDFLERMSADVPKGSLNPLDIMIRKLCEYAKKEGFVAPKHVIGIK